MKTLIQVGLLAVTTGIIAAMAAQPAHPGPNHGQAHNMHTMHNGDHPGQQHAEQRHRAIVQDRVLKPSRDWKVGQALPSHYYGNGYTVDHKRYKNLSKPGKNQRWIRVNGDYLLINTLNHSILKIIRD
jgi:Ni/Co efflux regulator RcnB